MSAQYQKGQDTDMSQEATSQRTSGAPGAARCSGVSCATKEGSTAIEFTMLAIPFSMLVFAVLESCISFAAQQVMANAADDVARQFRTGQIKAKDL
jgi:hypothetical protein